MDRSGPILLASTNPAKQAKLRWLLDGLGLRSITPGDLGLTPAIPEDGHDHRAIAEAKAAAWSRAAGMAALSSDGGLVIPALGDKWNALRTGRFAGESAGDRQRFDLGVRTAEAAMPALADDLRTPSQQAADHRVRLDVATAVGR